MIMNLINIIIGLLFGLYLINIGVVSIWKYLSLVAIFAIVVVVLEHLLHLL